MIAVQPWMFIAIVPIVIVAEGPEMTLEVITSFHNEYEPALVFSLIFSGGILAFLMEFSEFVFLFLNKINFNLFLKISSFG